MANLSPARSAWPVTLPLVAVGLLGAHELAYRLAPTGPGGFREPLEPDPDAHEALGLTDAEAGVDHLDAAAELSVADPFDLAFLDHMLHHRWAIFMTETMMLESEDQEMRRLALRIYVAQQEEIETMNAIRTEHYGGPVPEVVDHGVHGHVD